MLSMALCGEMARKFSLIRMKGENLNFHYEGISEAQLIKAAGLGSSVEINFPATLTRR
jgi:hypothetical protein